MRDRRSRRAETPQNDESRTAEPEGIGWVLLGLAVLVLAVLRAGQIALVAVALAVLAGVTLVPVLLALPGVGIATAWLLWMVAGLADLLPFVALPTGGGVEHPRDLAAYVAEGRHLQELVGPLAMHFMMLIIAGPGELVGDGGPLAMSRRHGMNSGEILLTQTLLPLLAYGAMAWWAVESGLRRQIVPAHWPFWRRIGLGLSVVAGCVTVYGIGRLAGLATTASGDWVGATALLTIMMVFYGNLVAAAIDRVLSTIDRLPLLVEIVGILRRSR